MMIQNKPTLTLALTLIASSIYAQEPVDIRRFVYDAVIAADCVQRKAPEDVCAQFIANIELMMRVGAAHQERVQVVLNGTPASDDADTADLVRAEQLRKVIKDAAVAAQVQYDNSKVSEDVWVTESTESIRQALNEKQNVENLYFKVFLEHMTSDPATYHKVKRLLNRRLYFFDALKPFKANQKAFFEKAKMRASR